MRTFKDYNDFHMKSNVMLLSDCFLSSRQTMYGLDCLRFSSLHFTLPSMTLLEIESSIRGGLYYVAHCFAKVNNPSLPDFDPELPKPTYII